MAKSLAVIFAIFGCGLIGTAVLVLEGEQVVNSITNYVMLNFYHEKPNGTPLDTSNSWLAIDIGIFAMILGATVFLAPRIMNRR